MQGCNGDGGPHGRERAGLRSANFPGCRLEWRMGVDTDAPDPGVLS